MDYFDLVRQLLHGPSQRLDLTHLLLQARQRSSPRGRLLSLLLQPGDLKKHREQVSTSASRPGRTRLPFSTPGTAKSDTAKI